MTSRSRSRAFVALIAITTAAAVSLSACKDLIVQRKGRRAIVELIPMGARKAKDDQAVITESEYRREIARVRLEREGNLSAVPLAPELKEAILQKMIDERLLAIEATRKGVRVSTGAIDREMTAIRSAYSPNDYERQLIDTYQTEADVLHSVKTRLMAAQLLAQEAFGTVKASEDEARKLWDSMPETEKVRPARVHAAQIVVRTEEEGRALSQELKKKGADFADLAKKKSVAPEAERGGDLGWFESGVMPSVFDEVCFSLKPGEVSELTASEYGFHIFKLLESEDEKPLTYEDARPQLFQRIREEHVRDAEARYMENLRSKVRVVRDEELIAAVE